MTLCENCRAAPATLALTRVEGGVLFGAMLCARCAALPFGAHPEAVLAQMLGAQPAAAPLTCPQCGMPYAQFAETQLLGCAACYQAFAGRLEPMIRHIHYAGGHVGKTPLRERRRE